MTHERHAPIQLGICAPNGDSASWYINAPWAWDNEHSAPIRGGLGIDWWLWDDRAFEVHGITKEQLTQEGKDIHTVNVEAVEFIKARSQVWKGQRKLVGWNVGSFDVPFLRKHLLGIASELSYQSADLNAITFAIAEARGINFGALKDQAHIAGANGADNILGTGDRHHAHDAGWDAVAALGAWDYLKKRIAHGY